MATCLDARKTWEVSRDQRLQSSLGFWCLPISQYISLKSSFYTLFHNPKLPPPACHTHIKFYKAIPAWSMRLPKPNTAHQSYNTVTYGSGYGRLYSQACTNMKCASCEIQHVILKNYKDMCIPLEVWFIPKQMCYFPCSEFWGVGIIQVLDGYNLFSNLCFKCLCLLKAPLLMLLNMLPSLSQWLQHPLVTYRPLQNLVQVMMAMKFL